MNVFFDSSAWAKRYIEETGSERVEEIGLTADNITLSVLCVPEVISAFARLQRETKISPDQLEELQTALLNDVEDTKLINITLELISRSVTLLRQFPLRTLDALHIASALAGQVDVFVTADRRQMEAAACCGLKTQFI